MKLPPIQSFDRFSVEEPFVIIGAAGFEDRALAVFQDLNEYGLDDLVDGGVGIEYEPYDTRNDVQGFEKGMSSVGVSKDKLNWITYDRRKPDAFEPSFRTILNETSCSRVFLDISGMSKYLIMLALHLLAEFDIQVTVFYAEADIYHPTKDKFKREKEELDDPSETPAFLTYGVYDIVTTRSLSSLTKSGHPIISIAFPTFNQQELMALTSELTPHRLIAIEGTPHHPDDLWRREAISSLNRDIESYIQVEWKKASTFDYAETFTVLNEIYQEYADTYRLVLAPTGSKLQTVGASLFRLHHPDIQTVYPVTRKFSETYTDGWSDTWAINLDIIQQRVEGFVSESDMKIARLRKRINEINEQIQAD